MLFWILLAFLALPFIGAVAGLVIALDPDDSCPPWVGAILGFIVGAFVALVPGGFAVEAWSVHANDVAKVEAQHHRITVYEERIESLEQRLSDFDYPSKPMVSVDADTPWASMVKSLNDAESELARAKDERAIAIRSISARMRGPMSGVVDFVGLPDGWDE